MKVGPRAAPRRGAMLPWFRAGTRRSAAPLSADPSDERAVAERLVAGARELLLVLGAAGADEALGLVTRPAAPARAEVLCPPDAGAEMIGQLLARGFVVYDSASTLDHSVLVLDRRLG